MAKKVVKLVKLQVLAGKATPAPPVGPALWSGWCKYHGFQLKNLMKELLNRAVYYSSRNYSF